jgi:hypothetical protein
MSPELLGASVGWREVPPQRQSSSVPVFLGGA